MVTWKPTTFIQLACLALFLAAPGQAAVKDELTIRRKGPFEFEQKPTIKEDGDKVSISFTSKGYCDVTVSIERPDGHILKHLASGVLGPNAPFPFKKNSLSQTVPWDGKDDQGMYIDDKSNTRVRVSLGLKARYERTLFWHPMKRVGLYRNPFLCAQPEGVYVYDCAGVEFLKLFSHEGEYVRTIYPYPADKVDQVKGITWNTHPDGFRFPQKQGYWRSTLQVGGPGGDHSWGGSAYSLAVNNGRVAVVGDRIGRFATDGTSGGMESIGPKFHPKYMKGLFGPIPITPRSAALSPDGKTLYLTACHANVRLSSKTNWMQSSHHWLHAVYRMDLEGDKPPELWLGERDKPGNDNQHFTRPSSVTCDTIGRVFIGDYLNNRVQVYSPEGKWMKTIPVKGPAQIQIDPKTQEIYVFSWRLPRPLKSKTLMSLNPTLFRMEGIQKAKPKLLAQYPLPLKGHDSKSTWWNPAQDPYRGVIDFWAQTPTVWLVNGDSFKKRRNADQGYDPAHQAGIVAFALKEGTLSKVVAFHEEVSKSGIQQEPPRFQRQRLYADPRNGECYVAEGHTWAGMGFTRLVHIDPKAGTCESKKIGVLAEDMAIDPAGMVYYRLQDKAIGRFNLDTGREVPYDYGVEWDKLIGVLRIPSLRPVYFHQSGMDVSPKGDLVVSCYNDSTDSRKKTKKVSKAGKHYKPKLYPGRYHYGEVHVFDKHGHMKNQDAIKGVPDGHGTFIDQQGDIYVLTAHHRILDKKKKFGYRAGTVMKFKPGAGKLYSQKKCLVALNSLNRPKGDPDLASDQAGSVWVEGAEWMYSGIGHAHPSAPCQCWNTRFDVDYFGRSFLPETDRCQVAVLDTNGNLMMHIGRYGNVDDGMPLVTHANPRLKIPNPRSIGGDEVSFVYPAYTATHSDHRLYVADPGNSRIVSIKLGYHSSHLTPLGTESKK